MLRSLLLGSAALILTAAAAQAAPWAGQSAAEAYLTPYAGIFNIMENGNHDSTGQFGLEYRYKDIFYGFRPTIGVNVDTDGGAYGYAGFHWDLPIVRDKLYLIPNFAAGLYHEGDSEDLGGAIEFRSGIELAYQFENEHRLGVAFNHISNASIYDKNPGAEALIVTYSIPLSRIHW